MTLGFIGTGALTSAVVTGFMSSGNSVQAVLLSPRNAAISTDLAARYLDVRVAQDNQAVLDGSETVMLAVRPQVAPEVLQVLRFRNDHHVVSLMATISRDEIVSICAPAERVTRALPMPMIAHKLGATIIFPPDPDIATFFGALGKAIEVESEHEFDALSVATATYATFFRYLDTIQDWLERHDVASDKARDYIATLFMALAHAPEAAPTSKFTDLAKEYATRGGINEQVLNELDSQGVFRLFAESLDSVHLRVSGS
jgi:pyrroline-5-carboxylate reductase